MAVEFLTYQWFFGDGQRSLEQNPSHVYPMPGEYTWICQAIFSNGVTLQTSGTIRVYDNSYAFTVNSDGSISFTGIITSRTDRCLRLAIPQKIEQGIGWSEYEGSDFPFPVGETGVCRVKDENEEFRPIAIDGNTFQVHELGRDDQWRDGEDEYAGTEIAAFLLLKEEYPPIGAAAILQHEQTHGEVKPWINAQRNANGYNAEGFRSTFSFDAFIRAGGLPTNHAITQRVPFRGQLVFDRLCKSPSLQIGWILRGAPWRFTRTQTWYKQIDSAAAPPEKNMTEEDWAMEWTEPSVWLARNADLSIDAARGTAITATILGSTTGPDSYNGSAAVLGAAGNFVLTDIDIGRNFTMNIWLRNLSAMTLFTIGNLNITVAAGWVLTWNDGVNVQNVTLDNDYADWAMLTINREGNTLRVYENGSLNNTWNLNSVELFDGTLTILQGSCRESDFILVPRNVSEDGIVWRYNDMIENAGNASCPIF